MFKFKKKDLKFLSKKVDKITRLFTKTVEKLQEKALEAEELRTQTIAKIEIMEKECDELKQISDKSKKLAYKISNIFEE